VQAAKGGDSAVVMRELRARPINDFMTKDGTIRSDGRLLREMYLFQVKTPVKSKRSWDFYKLVATIPANIAFRLQENGGCLL
jgi:branched-chain amino acid transport system substrate-binding protein